MNLRARDKRPWPTILHAAFVVLAMAALVWAVWIDRLGVALLWAVVVLGTHISDATDTIRGEIRGENR